MGNVTKLPASKVGFTLSISEDEFQRAREKAVNHFRGQVSVPGFRKGHAPEAMVIASVGPEKLFHEALERVLDDKYRAFIKQEKLSVIAPPSVDMKEVVKFPFEVAVEVEVFPEVTVGDHKKITLKIPAAKVDDKEMEKVLMDLCVRAGAGKEVKRAAKDGDIVKVDFEGFDEQGNTIPKTKAEGMTVHLGQDQFLKDLEKAYEGMKPGETKKDVKVSFPKEYPAPDVAGKKIPFTITLHQVLEPDVSALTPEDIEKIAGEKKTLEELKENIGKVLLQRQEEERFRTFEEQYRQKLLPLVKVELPASWIEKEVASRFERMREHPLFAHDPEAFWQQSGKDEAAWRAEFEKECQESLTFFLALSHIVKQEDVQLTDAEEKVLQDSSDESVRAQKNMDMRINKYLQTLLDSFTPAK